jgi:hypothetical protein
MEESMANSVVLTTPSVSLEVEVFAASKGILRHLMAVLDLAQQAFPEVAVQVSLGQDAEDETYRYIALDVDARSLSAEELLAGQRRWSAGIGEVCPARDAIYFVLGWH